MANLQKMTKAALVQLCNERGSEIKKYRNQLRKVQEDFDKTNRQLQEVTQQKKSLEADMDGTLQSFNDEKVKHAQEVQDLRKKITERDNTINEQATTYSELREQYDELVYTNGVNKSDVAKYKLTTIAFIILFVIALICACV